MFDNKLLLMSCDSVAKHYTRWPCRSKSIEEKKTFGIEMEMLVRVSRATNPMSTISCTSGFDEKFFSNDIEMLQDLPGGSNHVLAKSEERCLLFLAHANRNGSYRVS